MPVTRFTFTRIRVQCPGCGVTARPLQWTHDDPAPCACGGQPYRVDERPTAAPAVVGDEIDRTIEHGLCHADGTPQRFRSRQALHAAERAAGWRVLEAGERFHGDERQGARPHRR